MSEPRIYTGAEALALRADVLDVCKGCGTAWDFDRRRCAECDGTTVLFVRHRLPADLAASVAHHEAHAAGLESLLHTLASAALAAIGRAPSPEGTHPAEAAAYAVAQVRLFADDVTMARDSHFARATAAEAERDAALAHAAELTAALRVARSDLERLRADGRVELRERAERAEEALATERTARARAEAAMDERGLRLVAVVRERDALRAIVAGRREPPTAEDVRAIISVNGCFRYGYDDGEPGGTVTTYAGVTDVLRICDDGVEVWWWAQDALGTPCAWPTAEAPRG